jgi:hypothetical protein
MIELYYWATPCPSALALTGFWSKPIPGISDKNYWTPPKQVHGHPVNEVRTGRCFQILPSGIGVRKRTLPRLSNRNDEWFGCQLAHRLRGIELYLLHPAFHRHLMQFAATQVETGRLGCAA